MLKKEELLVYKKEELNIKLNKGEEKKKSFE